MTPVGAARPSCVRRRCGPSVRGRGGRVVAALQGERRGGSRLRWPRLCVSRLGEPGSLLRPRGVCQPSAAAGRLPGPLGGNPRPDCPTDLGLVLPAEQQEGKPGRPPVPLVRGAARGAAGLPGRLPGARARHAAHRGDRRAAAARGPALPRLLSARAARGPAACGGSAGRRTRPERRKTTAAPLLRPLSPPPSPVPRARQAGTPGVFF